MRITVVIPTLNEEKYLPRCLESLSKQTLSNFDVIVVDGGSTDRTVEIADSFGAKIIKLGEANLAKQRQIGFEAANTEIIASLDADTYVPEKWLEELVAPFSETQVVEVFGSLIYEGEHKFHSLLETVCERILFALGIPPAVATNLAVRKSAFEKVKGFYLPNGDFPKSYPELETVWLGMKLRHVGKVVFLPHLKVVTSPRRLGDPAMLYWWSVGYLSKVSRFVWWSLTRRILPASEE